ncbi:MAG: hypothetical protein WA790_15815 [Sulfitobacter sp.]
MHFTGSALALVAGIGMFFGVDQVAKVISPPVGIQVHSLTFEGGTVPAIIQDRTVTAKHRITAVFEAKVYKSTSVGLIEACSGGGAWDYVPGHVQANIPFDEWVADDGCYDRLPENVNIVACAEWRWGDGESDKKCTIGFRRDATDGS